MNQEPASLCALWITTSKMPECSLASLCGGPDQGQLFTTSGYLCGRLQRALQRSRQKENSPKFAGTEFYEVRLSRILRGSVTAPPPSWWRKMFLG